MFRDIGNYFKSSRSDEERSNDRRSSNDRSSNDRSSNDRSSNDRSSNDRSSNDRSIAEYRAMYSDMPLEEKRKLYKCGNSYMVIDEVPLWPVLYKVNHARIRNGIAIRSADEQRHSSRRDFRFKEDEDIPKEPLRVWNDLNMKLSLWQGDITKLEIDAITNAANESLLGGGGVDGCIHRAAGPTLVKECRLLDGCHTGEAKLTSGHRLPAKYVIHTVGPRGKNPTKLKACYENCLRIALENNIRSLAFCCISTGVFGYPNRDAAHVALLTARKWLEQHGEHMDRIIFCTYLSEDFVIYQELMADKYFPCELDEIVDPIGVERDFLIKNERKVPVETDEWDVRPARIPSESEDTSTKIISPVETDDLPSLEFSPTNEKRLVEPKESTFVYPEGENDPSNNYAVDAATESSQDPMLLGSQENNLDMDLGSQKVIN